MDGLLGARQRVINRVRRGSLEQLGKLTVTVLMGGPGAEREVSLASGAVVCDALIERGHSVMPADISPGDLSVLDESWIGRDDSVVFPVLHGTFGEDGELQSILQRRGVRYVGSNAASSRLAMDKHYAKVAFEKAGLMVPKGVLIKQNDIASRRLVVRKVYESLRVTGLPCVIKPNNQGSSLGVVIADSESAAVEAVGANIRNYGDCLVEQYITGQELTVGVLAGKALPILEVRTNRGFYDYHAKYEDDGTQYLFDGIGLNRAEVFDVQGQSLRAFSAVGARDFGRVDLIRDDGGFCYILEVNTIPGLTGHSLLPKAAGRAGISMSMMCEDIIRMAFRRSI